MTADGKLITGTGKAHDRGRGGFLCAFLFVFSLFFRVVVVVVLLLFWSVHSVHVYPRHERMQTGKNLITTPHARKWRRGLMQSPGLSQFPPGQNQDHDHQPPDEPSKT